MAISVGWATMREAAPQLAVDKASFPCDKTRRRATRPAGVPRKGLSVIDESAIEARALYKRHGAAEVLRGLDLAVRRSPF